MSNLSNSVVQMDGRTEARRMAKRETLLRVKMNRMSCHDRRRAEWIRHIVEEQELSA